MAKNAEHALALRRTAIAHMQGSMGLASFVEGRIYEAVPDNPTWPFVRWGQPINTPADASRIDGTEHRITVHGFAKGPYTDDAWTLGALIEAAMLDLPVGDAPELVQSQLLPDGNDWHVVCEFTTSTLELTA